MTSIASDLIDALELAREALRVSREHLKSHPGYSIKVERCIELAEREADKALARTEVEA